MMCYTMSLGTVTVTIRGFLDKAMQTHHLGDSEICDIAIFIKFRIYK
jgi:hypothetical protein